MKPSEIRAKVEEAKKKKQKLEMEAQELEKRNVFGRIEEGQQYKLIKERKTIAFNRRKKFLLWLGGLGIAASLLITSIVCIASFYLNRGKYLAPEDESMAGSGVISQESPDFQEVEKFLKAVISDQKKQAWMKTPSGIAGDGEVMKAIGALSGDDYRISYVQADRKANCYHVMCEFSKKGSYYFTVEKEASSLRLVSVVDFF